MRRGARIFLALLLAAALAGLWVEGAAADPSDSLADCAACHAKLVQEWSASPHAGAGQSEAFLRLLNSRPDALPGWTEPACLGCHTPLRDTDPAGLPGVTCQVCHGIESVEGIGNGGFALASDGILRGAAARQSPHQTVASALLSKSLLCASCHEQYHSVTGAPLQTTYSEWLNSPAASEGKACQDCHMRKAESASHTMSPTASAAKAESLGRAVSMQIQSPAAATAGLQVALEVQLLNEGAGHSLPTGKNESGEMWLQFTATGADGKILYEESLPYGVVYDDSDGKHDTPLNLWDAARIFKDRRLPPGRAVSEQFAFVIPVEARGNVRLEAALMYRAAPAWLLVQLSLLAANPASVQTTSATLQLLEPLPAPTYVAPTPLPTVLPAPTASRGPSGAGVTMEERDWLVPFLALGGATLIVVAFWVLRRRAV